MQRFLHHVGEKVTPLLRDTKFMETGMITAEEFVCAGDFLVYKCPTWTWQSVVPGVKQRSYLPDDRQFLVTRNVPCYERYNDTQKTVTDIGDDSLSSGEDGWITTIASKTLQTSDVEEITNSFVNTHIQTVSENEYIPDLETFDEDNILEDPNTARYDDSKIDDNIMKTRTYDLYITYDNYYRTPRIWLYGYNEAGVVLSAEEMFQDISSDHAGKTVTMETHSHLSIPMASVHPCRHAHVMKRMIDGYTESGKALRVDQYLLIFLKFMSAVLPTIDYDHTVSIDG